MAVGFKLIADPQTTEYRVVRIASQAYQIGQAVMWDRTADAIDVVPMTSSTSLQLVAGVAMEGVTNTATTLLIALVNPEQRWVADSTNTAATNDNNTNMVLTDSLTVNNTHTNSTAKEAVFMQTGVLSTNRIVGRFNVAYGVTA
jgi:hypothetical protein